MNLDEIDLKLLQINFITEYPLYTFHIVRCVSSDALKIKLMYLLAILMTHQRPSTAKIKCSQGHA